MTFVRRELELGNWLVFVLACALPRAKKEADLISQVGLLKSVYSAYSVVYLTNSNAKPFRYSVSGMEGMIG